MSTVSLLKDPPGVVALRGQSTQIPLAAGTFSGTSASTTYTGTLADGSALPAWLALNSVTGELSVTNASQSGIYDVLITANDGSVQSAPAVETVTVTGSVSVVHPLPDRAFANTAAFTFAIPADDFSATGATSIRYDYSILGAIDSLTAGVGSTYETTLMAHLRADYLDGGAGYEAFTQNKPLISGSATASSGRVTYLAGPTATPGIERYSINGQGIDITGGDGKDFFTWTPGTAWDTATVYYLQQPDGGFMTIYGAGASAAVTVNTAGPLALKSVTVESDRGQSDSALRIDKMTGHLTVFGSDFELDHGGASFSNIAIGGTSLTNWSKLDSSFRQAWFGALSPDVYVLDAGMNDRGILTQSQYQALVDGVLNDFAAASPHTKIILVGPNDIGNGGTDYLAMFRTVLQQEAQTRGLVYVNDMSVLGNYSAAVAWLHVRHDSPERDGKRAPRKCLPDRARCRSGWDDDGARGFPGRGRAGSELLSDDGGRHGSAVMVDVQYSQRPVCIVGHGSRRGLRHTSHGADSRRAERFRRVPPARRRQSEPERDLKCRHSSG